MPDYYAMPGSTCGRGAAEATYRRYSTVEVIYHLGEARAEKRQGEPRKKRRALFREFPSPSLKKKRELEGGREKKDVSSSRLQFLSPL
jgi:hypothetical protein